MQRFYAWAAVWALLVCMVLAAPRSASAQIIISDDDDTGLDSFFLTGPVAFDPNDRTLSQSQKARIVRAHAVAMQQVEAALLYLRVNAAAILAGQDEWFNDHFGNFYNPGFSANEPIVDTTVFAGLVNPKALGLGEISGTTANFSDLVIGGGGGFFISDVTDTGGFTLQAGVQKQPVYSGQVQEGDIIFTNGQFWIIPEDGITLEAVFKGSTAATIGGEDGGTGGETGGEQTGSVSGTMQLVINSISFEPLFEDNDPPEQPDDIPTLLDVFLVPSMTFSPNLEHYQEVIETFQELQAALSTPTLFVGGEFDQEGVLLALGDPEDPNSLGFRQFGFSNSLSELHLSQIASDPDNPLLWIEEEFEDFFQQMTVVPGFTEDGLVLFLGDAFFDQEQTAGGLFDTEATDQKVAALADYQQLMAAYLEAFSTLQIPATQPGEVGALSALGAAFGIDAINSEAGVPSGTQTTPFPQNTDASNFAGFADVDGPVGDDALNDVPPPNKQGMAGPQGMFIIEDPFGLSLFVPEL